MKTNPWRFVWHALAAFAVTGYLLFFLVQLVPLPEAFRENITYFASTIRSLNTAAKIAAIKGDDPTAIQLVILYSAIGSIALTFWCSCKWLSDPQALAASVGIYSSLPVHKRPSKSRVILASVLISTDAFFGWYVLFQMEKTTTGWRETALFSTSMQSVTALIISSSILALSIPVAIVFSYVALLKNPQP